jgi:formylmethanofuran dehydrogenase subunit D
VSTPEEYRAKDPKGRAVLKVAHYAPPPEQPDQQYPFLLSTGRVLHHFHTRTKTGRSRALVRAAPDAFVQLAESDARELGIAPGDLVRVTSRRGSAVAPARLGDIEPGHVFMPFHWGDPRPDGRRRAANELTTTEWDPSSKQPIFKYAAVSVAKAPAPKRERPELGRFFVATGRMLVELGKALSGKRRHVPDYVGLLIASEKNVAEAFATVARRHEAEPDILDECRLFSKWSSEHVERLEPFRRRLGARTSREAKRLRRAVLDRGRKGGFGLLQDLHDLWLLAHEVHVCWNVLGQAVRALRDEQLEREILAMTSETDRQIAWLRTRIKQAAPQALTVPS